LDLVSVGSSKYLFVRGSSAMLGFYLAMLETAEEKSKFEELHEHYCQEMFKRALFILRNTHDAEDAVQEAFLRVAKCFSRISDLGSSQTRAYLIIVVKNVANDILKKRLKSKAENIDEHVDVSGTASTEEVVISNIAIEMVIDAARNLPDSYYDILVLSIVNGLSTRKFSFITKNPI
jgi:RNA polymerase sigma-70 factor (ECF subfamily)